MFQLSYKYPLGNLQVSRLGNLQVSVRNKITIYRHKVNVSVKLQVSVR